MLILQSHRLWSEYERKNLQEEELQKRELDKNYGYETREGGQDQLKIFFFWTYRWPIRKPLEVSVLWG